MVDSVLLVIIGAELMDVNRRRILEGGMVVRSAASIDMLSSADR